MTKKESKIRKFIKLIKKIMIPNKNNFPKEQFNNNYYNNIFHTSKYRSKFFLKYFFVINILTKISR